MKMANYPPVGELS